MCLLTRSELHIHLCFFLFVHRANACQFESTARLVVATNASEPLQICSLVGKRSGEKEINSVSSLVTGLLLQSVVDSSHQSLIGDDEAAVIHCPDLVKVVAVDFYDVKVLLGFFSHPVKLCSIGVDEGSAALLLVLEEVLDALNSSRFWRGEWLVAVLVVDVELQLLKPCFHKALLYLWDSGCQADERAVLPWWLSCLIDEVYVGLVDDDHRVAICGLQARLVANY